MAAQEAYDRVHGAVRGKPRDFVKVKTGEDDDGNDITEEARPTVEVVAGDILDLTGTVPAASRSQIVKDLRGGVLRLPRDLKVRCQARCLWRLLGEAATAMGLPAPE